MTAKAAALPTSAHRGQRKPVEVTALIASRRWTKGELQRVSSLLAAEGLGEIRESRVVLKARDAAAVSAGQSKPIAATLLPVEPDAETPEAALARALSEARERGEQVKADLDADPTMLATAEIANQLGMSPEGIRVKRRRHEILGLEGAKRGIQYPAWQLIGNRQLLPGLARVFAVLGDDPWRVYRFLEQRHPELGGSRARDALRDGRIDQVAAAAENIARGAFA